MSGITPKQVGESYLITLGIFLSPQGYITLRAIPSLIGDIYNLLTPLKSADPAALMELSTFVDQLYTEADKFREIRNCFTHIDDVLTNMDKHGIAGAAQTHCGIKYLPNTIGCVHLIWNSNVIHFTYKGKAYEMTIDKPIFNLFFK